MSTDGHVQIRAQWASRRMETGGLCFLIFSFACLAVLGVSCGTWDLPSLFWQAGFLAEAWDPVP